MSGNGGRYELNPSIQKLMGFRNSTAEDSRRKRERRETKFRRSPLGIGMCQN